MDYRIILMVVGLLALVAGVYMFDMISLSVDAEVPATAMDNSSLESTKITSEQIYLAEVKNNPLKFISGFLVSFGVVVIFFNGFDLYLDGKKKSTIVIIHH